MKGELLICFCSWLL